MRRFRDIVGLAISVALIWYLFRGTDWSEVGRTVANLNWGWLALAQATVFASMFTRVWRLEFIMRGEHSAGYFTLFSATQIGIMGNYVLPGRVGELIRAFLLGRLVPLPLAKAIAFATLDRVADVLCLLIVLVVAASVFTPGGEITLPAEIYAGTIPGDLVSSVARATALLALTALLGLAILYFGRKQAAGLIDALLRPLSPRVAAVAISAVADFAGGLNALGRAGNLFQAFTCSVLTWALMILSMVFLFEAFGLTATWTTFFVLTAFIAIAVSIPGAPGFVGQFHFAFTVVVVAMMPETGIEKAKAAAIIAHLLNVVPVVVLGSVCLYWTRVDIFSLGLSSRRAVAADSKT